MSANRLAVSRIVEASPSVVFRIVCDPEMHVEIDGSGMLQAARGSKPVTAVGDEFELEMDREPLGDVPMGKYKASTRSRRSFRTSCSNGMLGARSEVLSVTPTGGRYHPSTTAEPR